MHFLLEGYMLSVCLEETNIEVKIGRFGMPGSVMEFMVQEHPELFPGVRELFTEDSREEEPTSQDEAESVITKENGPTGISGGDSRRRYAGRVQLSSRGGTARVPARSMRWFGSLRMKIPPQPRSRSTMGTAPPLRSIRPSLVSIFVGENPLWKIFSPGLSFHALRVLPRRLGHQPPRP